MAIKVEKQIQITSELYHYINEHSLRESEVLQELREETFKDAHAAMQISPIQGQFLALIVQILCARRTIEIGTYTGYSTLWVALATPPDGMTIACDINSNWGNIARKFWRKAGVDNKIDLRIGPAKSTLTNIIETFGEGAFDFIFIDADKSNYDTYFELALILVRKGGIIAIDNTLMYGSVAMSVVTDADLKDTKSLNAKDVNAIKSLNKKLKVDNRVDLSMLPLADGLTLVRKK